MKADGGLTWRLGELAPVDMLEPGTFVELIGQCLRYPGPGGCDSEDRWTNRVRITGRVNGGVLVRGWMADGTWGEPTASGIEGAKGRVVSHEHAQKEWGCP